MKSKEEIIADLHNMSNPRYVQKMEYFGIVGAQALGIKHAMLKPYAKTLGKDQTLAEVLWNEKIHEAKHLSVYLAQPTKISLEVVEKWISELYSWDICDGLCMKVLPKTPYAYEKIADWSTREREFEKRAGFATMVGIILNRKVPDKDIEAFFPLIEQQTWDERNFVKKAVNWALRQVGKRNLNLNKKAIECAQRIKSQSSKAAKWIASDALRELRSTMIQERLARNEKRRAD